MAAPFEIATRAAIEEIIQTHAQESRFGYVLTHESFAQLTTDLFELMATARTLKAAGDRFLAGGGPEPKRPGAVKSRPRP